jgi:hypothetical protein
MNWFLVAYLVALAYLTVQKKDSLGSAWFWLGILAFSHTVFALFRAGNATNPRDLILVEIWANGFEWLFLGLSIRSLAGVLKKDESDTPTP